MKHSPWMGNQTMEGMQTGFTCSFSVAGWLSSIRLMVVFGMLIEYDTWRS